MPVCKHRLVEIKINLTMSRCPITLQNITRCSLVRHNFHRTPTYYCRSHAHSQVMLPPHGSNQLDTARCRCIVGRVDVTGNRIHGSTTRKTTDTPVVMSRNES